MNAFKSQQHRWAKGSIQTCRKLLPHILQSDLPLKVKVEAFFHLTANFNYLLMIVLSVLMFPAMVVRYNMGWTEMLLIDMPLFLAATVSVFNFYLISQRETYPDWRSRVKYLPFVMAIGIGLAVNNTQGGARGAVRQAERVHAHAEVRHRAAQRRLAAQEVSPVDADPAVHRTGARPVLHRHGLLRADTRHLRHAAVPDAVPVRVPLHGPDVDLPADRRRRPAREGAADRRRQVISASATALTQ